MFCCFVLCSVTNSASNISTSINSIPMFNSINFNSWQENVMIVLRVMDLDLALRVVRSADLIDESSSYQRREVGLFKSHESNDNEACYSRSIQRHYVRKVTTAKEFFEEIEKWFAKNEKAETSTLLENLISMRYKGKENIREYIMKMSHLASKLKALNLEMSEDLLVDLVLISLSTQFSQFKVSYNYQKDTWSLNELISHFVQEDERIKQEKVESAHLATTSKDKRKNNKRKKDNEASETTPQKKQKEQTDDKYFFYGDVGHKKKQCTNYHSWRAKKGMLLNLVYSEVNLNLVPIHTWWIDSGVTTHISGSMQSCLICRKSSDDERYINVGDGKSFKVEAIRTFRLFLRTEFYLDLSETFIVPSFRQNWIYISALGKFRFSCSFGNSKFSLFQDTKLIGIGSLSVYNNLYFIDTIASFNKFMKHTKCKA